MMFDYVLSLTSPNADLETVGGKGAALARMAAAGLPVPKGFYVTTAAYHAFVAANGLKEMIGEALGTVDLDQPSTLDQASEQIRHGFESATIPRDVAGAIARAYAGLAGPDPVVAVRSSATAEDLPDLSFAGQQETYLNITGIESVLTSVRRCWASLWTGRAIGYRMRHGISAEGLGLAVVVQRLVPAEVAGILFTANPLNGRRDQAVVNAAWGLGEAVVGGLVTPDTYVVAKETGAVAERSIADKATMTVRIDGGTEDRPVSEDLRQAPSLDDDQIAALVALGERVEHLYGSPRDIEWALADGKVWLVQARPITALPEPEVMPPQEWPLPDPKGQYLRASIIDLMPDPLRPLFATLGLRAINRALQNLVVDIFKSPPTTLPDETTVTINGYAYMQVSYTPKQWWLMATRLVPRFPGMLKSGLLYWQEKVHPEYVEVTRRWQSRSVLEMASTELLQGSQEMAMIAARHLASLMASTMGPSAGSEGLFTAVYQRLVRRGDDPEASTFLMGFDNIPMRAEKALHDLAQWVEGDDSLVTYLTGTASTEVASDLKDVSAPAGLAQPVWSEWRRRFDEYLDDYGYAIYFLDFTRSLPMDDPAPMLETLRLFVTGVARSPYERQQALQSRRETALRSVRGRIKGLKRWAFEKTLAWAQKLAPLREDGIAEIGLGYPVLRRMLLELGRRLVAAGAIADAEDVFWLKETELGAAAAALDDTVPVASLVDKIETRKALWRAEKRVTPPPQLPPKGKYLGMSTDIWTAASEESQTGDAIKGVSASPGRVTAKASVLHGPEDFDRMQRGNVLVADITTPAWTPLFAMASGVVTNVGGPLSHGSIVAREYGIPAVLGTGVATKRIHTDQVITVDGDAGLVMLVDGDGAPSGA
jgi:rifampicin phosphotransferase